MYTVLRLSLLRIWCWLTKWFRTILWHHKALLYSLLWQRLFMSQHCLESLWWQTNVTIFWFRCSIVPWNGLQFYVIVIILNGISCQFTVYNVYLQSIFIGLIQELFHYWFIAELVANDLLYSSRNKSLDICKVVKLLNCVHWFALNALRMTQYCWSNICRLIPKSVNCVVIILFH